MAPRSPRNAGGGAVPGDSTSIGHLFVIRWDSIETGDIVRVTHEVRKIRQAAGRPVIYVAIQDDGYREPDGAAKKEMTQTFPDLMRLVKFDYLVISATGVRASLQRSFLKALITAGRLARMADLDRVVILDRIEEVFVREADDLPAPRAAIMAKLREARVLR
jgi:hypothetical protein